MKNLEDAVRHVQVDGWCVVEEIIPVDKVDAVRESVEATVAVYRRPDAPEGIGFVPGVISVNQSFAPYVADRYLLRLVEALLGEHVRISFTSAIVNYPGNKRGEWHADWPFNQRNAGHIPAPYPDAVIHLTTLWILSPFTTENGGTLIVPGSHHTTTNPTGNNGVDPLGSYPAETHVTGPAGSVLVMDSRLWHATAPNCSDRPRVALAVRYAPWWLNLEVLMPGSVERTRMVDETGKTENIVPPVPPHVYGALPDDVKPLYRHWVRGS
jgi:hypothetical protein